MKLQIGDYVEHLENEEWRGTVIGFRTAVYTDDEVKIKTENGATYIVWKRNVRKKHNELALIQRFAREAL